MLKVIPLGGAEEIGASCLWFETSDLAVLVDFGARPGKSGPEAYPHIPPDLVKAGKPRALLLTHAHHDHVGGLPVFHRLFPNAPVLATAPSIRIAETLLGDSLHIQEIDADRNPDYSAEDVQSLMRSCVPVEFGQTRLVVNEGSTCVTARFHRAGHILGAAVIEINFINTALGLVSRVVVSGDVSDFDQPTIPGTDLEALLGLNPDLLVMEGTYGARDHESPGTEAARFVETVARVVRGGGRVVIPAFAVGRAQNVAILLRRAQQDPLSVRKELGDPGFIFPRTPILIDGMARACADHYDAFRDQLHPELRSETRASRHVFFDERGIVQRVASPVARRAITDSEGPWITIAPSGMLIGGAIIPYAKAISSDPRSALFLVGYQDEESPGAVLEKGRSRGRSGARLIMGGESVTFHAGVHRYHLSGHAYASGLEAICGSLEPASIQLVHGDPDSLEALASRLRGYLKERRAPARVGVAKRNLPFEVAHRPLAQRADIIDAIAHPSMDAPIQASTLTGLLSVQGTATPRPDTSAETLTLKRGWGIGVTAKDIARTQAFVETDAPLIKSDIQSIRQGIEKAVGDSWMRRGGYRGETVFSPSASRALRPDSHAPRIPWHRSGVESFMEYRPGDLVLIDARGRVEPAVLAGYSKDVGLLALTPSGDEAIDESFVLARIGAWPFPGAGVDEVEFNFIRRLGVALEAMQVPLGSLNREKELDMLFNALSDSRITPMAASIGHRLLTLEGIDEGVDIEKVSLEIGMEGLGLGNEEIDSFDSLADAGFVHFRHSGVRTEVVWRIPGRGDAQHGATETLDDLLGPGINEIVTEAHTVALRNRRLRAEEAARETARHANVRTGTQPSPVDRQRA